MLQVVVPGVEFYDEVKNEFIELGEETLNLEHSLVAISKWESKHHRSFLAHKDKTNEEMMDYIKCMTINKVSQYVYQRLTKENFERIKEYIEDPMTATYINRVDTSTGPKDTVTAELIYYWMVALQIPFECQYWHLNRLMALIEVCNIKNKAASGTSKMSKGDIMRKNAALNAARRRQAGSRG